MMKAISLSRSSSLFRASIPLSPSWARVAAETYSQDTEPSAERLPRLFVVQPRLRPESTLQAKLEEAVCLAKSLEEQRDGLFDGDFSQKEIPQHIVVQNPSARGHKARADTYFGPGTVETVKITLNHVESQGEVDAVFVNTMLSGVQQRNLERAWGKPVLDRVGLIIEIFNAHANTKEGKLQAELAALMYKKTRLVRVRGSDGRLTFGADGEAEVVSARGRGSGGRGFIGGAGETELHLQRRRISERRKILLAQVEEVRRTRALQRASRKRHGGSHGQALATVAVVGYTNAGKSTLVSALSDSPLFSDSRLFATVDPRLRNVVLPSGKVLLSDTVGFISDLPVQLVEAFHATLEEVVEADLLVHVLDSTTPNLDEHRSTVLRVLEQIGVPKEKFENMIEVWNKIDFQDKLKDGNEHDDGEEEDDDDDVDDAETSNISLEDGKDLDDQDDDDHSDEKLNSEDDQSSSVQMQMSQTEASKDSNCVAHNKSAPVVKTSALKRIGLQELLELVDQRLKEQDDKFKPKHVLERNVFDKKWRPSSVLEDSEVAI